MFDNMVNPQRLCHCHRLIATAVIDHQKLDGVNTIKLRRQIGNRLRQRLRFVVTGNLDDEFHKEFKESLNLLIS
jgi:hypothetical protein